MRRSLPLLVAAALTATACESEPTFDERYETAQDSIRETARDIDSELRESQAEATGDDAAGSEAPALDDTES